MKRATHALFKPRQSGFTIIEVLVVIVIAAIIMVIIFLAVPALQRNARNDHRRNAVGFVATQLDAWAHDHNGRYPYNALSKSDPAQDFRDQFIDSLGEDYANAKTTPPGTTTKLRIRYTDQTTPHEYPFHEGDPTYTVDDNAMDEISIEPGHSCNTGKPGDKDYPLKTAAGGDENLHAYVVWTQLEMAPVMCVSNHPD